MDRFVLERALPRVDPSAASGARPFRPVAFELDPPGIFSGARTDASHLIAGIRGNRRLAQESGLCAARDPNWAGEPPSRRCCHAPLHRSKSSIESRLRDHPNLRERSASDPASLGFECDLCRGIPATLLTMSVERPACVRVAAAWDQVVKGFFRGQDALPSPLDRWFESYKGSGLGRVRRDAMPEPYGGSLLRGQPRIVFLSLNPGRPYLEFQGRNGSFGKRILASTYDEFAATPGVLSQEWQASIGRNPYVESRVAFMQRWHEDESLDAAVMQTFELYPWHSDRVTASFRPDPGIIREFIWDPIQELGGPPVFAFGAPWFDLLPRLGLEVVDCLGRGGRAYGSRVTSRSVLLLRGPTGGLVVAEKHSGGVGPPAADETRLLREAVEAIAPMSFGGVGPDQMMSMLRQVAPTRRFDHSDMKRLAHIYATVYCEEITPQTAHSLVERLVAQGRVVEDETGAYSFER